MRHPCSRSSEPTRVSHFPSIAICLVGICGFVALAIDVGRVAVAKVECQAAADVAAMAGVRTLSGILPQNLTAASTAAQIARGRLELQGHGPVDLDLERRR